MTTHGSPHTEGQDDEAIVLEYLQQIRKDLLNLSPRNRLLNFRPNAKTVELLDSASTIYDSLVEHDRHSPIKPLPDLKEELDVADHAHEGPSEAETEATLVSLFRDKYQRSPSAGADLQSLLPVEKLERSLRKVRSDYDLAINETGLNLLYVALGFLKWRDENSETWFRAPMVLIPVAIVRDKYVVEANMYEYRLSYDGTDVQANLTLAEKLRHDYGIALPELFRASDDEGQEVAFVPSDYYDRVRQAVSTMTDWQVEQHNYLAFFHFTKQRMYHDLDPAHWTGTSRGLLQHELIEDVLLGRTPEPGQTVVPRDAEADSHTTDAIPLVLDADSSQRTALTDALDGKNLVIQGPPGTGKSQTITNLIAAAISRGKTVLFMSEKLAALDVVMKNMQEADLDDFCLDLHSKTALKKAVMASLKKRKNGYFPGERTIAEKKAQLEETRNALAAYVAAISEVIHPVEQSAYDILGRALLLRSELDNPLSLIITNTGELDRNGLEERKHLLDTLSKHIAQYPSVLNCAWHGLRPKGYMLGLEDDVANHLEALATSLEQTTSLFEDWRKEHNLPDGDSEYSAWKKFADAGLDDIPDPPNSLVASMSAWTPMQEKTVEELIALVTEYQHLGNALGTRFGNGRLLDIDMSMQEQAVRTLIELTGTAATYAELMTLLSAFTAAEQALSHLMTFAQLFESINFPRLDTIQTCEWAVDLADHIRACPAKLQNTPTSGFLQADANTCLTEERQAFEQLCSQHERLTAIFALGDVADDNDFASIRRNLRKHRSSPFRMLSRQYRSARAECLAILRDRKMFARDSFPENLELLEAYLQGKNHLAATAQAPKIFGDHFEGMTTDWDSIACCVEWCHNLIEKSGSAAYAQQVLEKLQQIVEHLPATETLKVAVRNVSDTQHALKELLNRFPNGHDFGLNIDVSTAPVDIMHRQCSDAKDRIGALVAPLPPLVPTQEESLETLAHVVRDHARFVSLSELVRKHVAANALGHHFRDVDTSVEAIRAAQKWLLILRGTGLPPQTITAILTGDIGQQLNAARHLAGQLGESLQVFGQVTEKLRQLGHFDIQTFFGEGLPALRLLQVTEKCRQCLAELQLLQPWTQYCLLRQRSEKLGTDTVVQMATEGKLPPRDMATQFEYSFYNSIATDLINRNPILLEFAGYTHEMTRDAFRQLDREMRSLERKQVAAETSSRFTVPMGVNRGRVRDLSEIGLINREIEKKSRHIPIRQLMKRAGKAIQALKPCFMMSPLSVAQFVEPGSLQFDLIVVDEASQLKPGDAIGALARGRQLVVVGDSRQLPPSTFFEAIGSDDVTEDENPLAAVESILDACARVYQGGTRTLKWHYRSRHHSLISFSNSRYYDNSLLIFPSPSTSEALHGIQYHYVEKGYYFAGAGRRHNPTEAEVVAGAVISHGLKYPKQSLGVAAMNIQQKELIEDCLERITKDDPMARSAVEHLMKLEEPLFVKNLENVQGDERDVIFVSCTYGPDPESGAVLKRFGPVNNRGGERRLNVLFTRAKNRMEIFTSMLSTQLGLDHTASQGARDLKDFLLYVETGVLADQGHITGREPDSDFEVAVGREIVRLGYSIEYQLGVAGFFIDLAVYSPGSTERFMLGVECDGAAYHSSRSARDRDRLREEVLKSRGWKIYRVWSTDWFKDRDREIAKLEQALSERAAKVIERVGNVQPDERPPQHNGCDAHSAIDVSGPATISQPAAGQIPDIIPSTDLPRKLGPDDISQEQLQKAILRVLLRRPNNTCAVKNMTSETCRELNIITRSGPRAALEQRVLLSLDTLTSKGVIKKYQTSKNERVQLVSRFLAEEMLKGR